MHTALTGTMTIEALKSSLKGLEYQKAKSAAWGTFIDNGLRPIKWHQTTPKGTKVTVRKMVTAHEYAAEREKLARFRQKLEAEIAGQEIKTLTGKSAHTIIIDEEATKECPKK